MECRFYTNDASAMSTARRLSCLILFYVYGINQLGDTLNNTVEHHKAYPGSIVSIIWIVCHLLRVGMG